MKGENPEEAIKEFLGVPPLEPEKGDWFVRPLYYDLGGLKTEHSTGVSKD